MGKVFGAGRVEPNYKKFKVDVILSTLSRQSPLDGDEKRDNLDSVERGLRKMAVKELKSLDLILRNHL